LALIVILQQMRYSEYELKLIYSMKGGCKVNLINNLVGNVSLMPAEVNNFMKQPRLDMFFSL